MKIGHLLKEDLKRVAWLMLLNLGVALAYAYPFSGFADRLVDDEAGFRTLERLGPFLMVLYGLTAALVTSGLLRKDAVCDVDAFWLSKPIDGLQLLVSKGIVLFVVYFALPWILLWLVADNSGVEMPLGVLIWHGYWALWFAPAVIFFTVQSKGLSSMLVGVIAFAATLGLGYAFFKQVIGVKPELGGFSHLAAYVIYVGSVSTAIVLLFLSRRISLSRWIAAVGVLVAIAIPLLRLDGYLGPSDRIKENAELARSLVVSEPVVTLTNAGGAIVANGSFEIENAPEDLLFHTMKVRARFGESWKPPIAQLEGRGVSSVGPRTLQRSLAESLSEMKEWSIENVYALHSSRIEFEDKLLVEAAGSVDDPAGRWEFTVTLARLEIEKVTVVPFEDGQEVELGGIRTLLRRTGAASDYRRYMIFEYYYEDLTTSQPIQFHPDEPVGRPCRLYFLKGKSGRLWQPEIRFQYLSFAWAFGLDKRIGSIEEITPLTDGPDDEELELVAIDVRHLGNIRLNVGERPSL